MQIERQYIGARYVPKFFEGAGGSAEWVPGIAYEPLTIVTYLGNSFTSKVPVPSTVGTPNVNTEYWVNTGNYNEQIEEYRKEVANAGKGRVKFFDTFTDLYNSQTLASGDFAITLGKNAVNDGSWSFYLISNVQPSSGYYETLPNNLYAVPLNTMYAISGNYGSLQEAIDDENVSELFLNTDYTLTEPVDVGRSKLTIYGNGHEIICDKMNMFNLAVGVSDLRFVDIKFKCIDASLKSEFINTQINQEAGVYHKNLHFDGCTFNGATNAIVLNKTSDVTISNCVFENFMYYPSTQNGGYGILLQQCENLLVDNCIFQKTNSGRHDIYVSNLPGSSNPINNKNVTVRNCKFDHSDYNQNSGDSTCINIRGVEGMVVENCLFINIGNIMHATDNYDVDNLMFTGCRVSKLLYFNITGAHAACYTFKSVNGNKMNVSVVNTIIQDSEYITLITSENAKVNAFNNIAYAVMIMSFTDTVVVVDGFKSQLNTLQYRLINLLGNGVLNATIKNVSSANSPACRLFVGENAKLNPDSIMEYLQLFITNNTPIMINELNVPYTVSVVDDFVTVNIPCLNQIRQVIILPQDNNVQISNVGITGNTIKFKVNAGSSTNFTGLVRVF